MSNATRYNFSDFTLENYRKLLQLGLENYSFRFFHEDYVQKSILLRHDVEFSIHNALRMAKIEASLGINSTYFVQLHSEFYNALEKVTIETIHEIIRLGHKIGLHFDVHYWHIQREKELEKYICIDKKTLEEYTGAEIKVFSFHNNNGFTMSYRREQYAGLLNVYSDYFRDNYGYNADSLGYWRYERLEDRLREAKEDALQILIHDGMWQDEVLPPRRRVFKVIDENAERLKNYYDDFLKNAGLNNIDW